MLQIAARGRWRFHKLTVSRGVDPTVNSPSIGTRDFMSPQERTPACAAVSFITMASDRLAVDRSDVESLERGR